MPQPKKPILDLGPKSPMLLALEKARKDRLARIPALTNTKPGAARRELTGAPGGSAGGGSGGGGGGGGGAPAGASYITRLAESGLSNETALASLATGYLKNTTGTGVPTVQAVPIPATDGGTGQTSFAVGDLLYASTTTALSKLADVATGNVLLSGGVNTAPAYGKVGLTTHVSGTLPVGNGGTGATTLTGILKGNGTSAITAYNSFTDNRVVRADGTGGVQTSGWSITDADSLECTSGSLTSISAGAATGVVGQNTSANNYGVLGNASAATGTGQGVRGLCSSTNNAAYGVAALRGGTTNAALYSAGPIDIDEVSAPSTPGSGKVRLYADTSERLLSLDDLGNTRSLVGLVYRQTTVQGTDNINNTTTKTAFGSTWSMPANTLKSGKMMRVTAWGEWGSDAATPTRYQLFVVFNDAGGDVDVVTFNQVNAPGTGETDGTWFFQADILCAATDTVRCGGQGAYRAPSAGVISHFLHTTPGSVTVDTDTATTVKIMAHMSMFADADNFMELQGFNVEIM